MNWDGIVGFILGVIVTGLLGYVSITNRYESKRCVEIGGVYRQGTCFDKGVIK